MSLLSNLKTKTGSIKLTATTIDLKKRKTKDANPNDSQTTVATQTTVTEVTVAEEVAVAKVVETNERHGEDSDTVLSTAMISKMLSQKLALSSSPIPSLRDSISSRFSKKNINEVKVAAPPPPPPDLKSESVYIVLRPLELREAPEENLKKLGRIVTAVDFDKFLLLQHWGLLVGKQYYHLHLDDNKKISVSLVPFIDAKAEHHTIKVPIWRTNLTHDERVGVAVGIIKSMGDFKAESEVDITDEGGNVVTYESNDRQRYKMEGRYLPPAFYSLQLFKGGYNPLTNNCIHFTAHYIFGQLVPRFGGLKYLADNIWWLVEKWIEMGCKKSPRELAAHLSGIFGVVNPFSLTPTKLAEVLVKLLSIFLNIDYNSSLDKKDKKPKQKPTMDAEETPAETVKDKVEA